EYERVTHDGPVFIGDTIYTRSTILETRLSSKADRGVVYLETVATNQRGEKVLTLRRRVLVPTLGHATLGQGKLP
ncbi:MAG: MaoC family dehydratase, partial [Chloroflexi bacterium]|nr:MaoC family dehydratase [Chloroflexota bacterium]